MSRENIDIVRSIYEASNRRDWDAAFRDQAPNVEVTTPPGIFAGTFRGGEECQGFFEEMTGAFEEWSVHVDPKPREALEVAGL